MTKRTLCRMLTSLLCALLACLLLSCGCSSKNGSDASTDDTGAQTTESTATSGTTDGTVPSQPPAGDDPAPVEYLLSYEDVIDLFELRRLHSITNAASDGKRTVAISGGFPSLDDPSAYGTEREQRIVQTLIDSTRIFYDSFMTTYSCFDINRDGTEELLLLQNDYTVSAIFTMRADDNGIKKPVLLVGAPAFSWGGIDTTGNICIRDLIAPVYQVFRIDSEGELMLISEYGYREKSYYEVINGNRVEISGEAYTRLQEAFDYLFRDMQGRTRATGIRLQGECFSSAGVELSVIQNARAVFVYRQWMRCYWEAYQGYSYALADVNGDKQIDLILYAPDGSLLLYEYSIDNFGCTTVSAAWRPTDLKKDGTMTIESLSENGEQVVKVVCLGENLGHELAKCVGDHTFFVDGLQVEREAYDAFMRAQRSKPNLFLYEMPSDLADLDWEYPYRGEYVELTRVELDARTYEGILEIYRCLATEYKYGEQYFFVYPEDDAGLTSRVVTQLRERIKRTHYGIFDDEVCDDLRDGYGYAYRDLDGDGTKELILMTDLWEIIDIFGQRDGAAVPLIPYDRMEARIEGIWLDEDGRIYLQGYKSGDYVYIYRIEGAEAIEEILLVRSYASSLDYRDVYYVRYQSDKLVKIDQTAYYSYLRSYPYYSEVTQIHFAKYSRMHAELEFCPLYKRADPMFINHRLYSDFTNFVITLSKPAGKPLTMIRFGSVYSEVVQDADGNYTFVVGDVTYRLELCSVGVWIFRVEPTGEILMDLYTTAGGSKG